jgi:hypothetical protein
MIMILHSDHDQLDEASQVEQSVQLSFKIVVGRGVYK